MSDQKDLDEQHRRWVIAQKMNAMPIKEDQAGQKFKRGQKVRIADDLGHMKPNFKNACDAIIDHSYSQEFGGDNVSDYAVLLIDDEARPLYSCAWFHVEELTLIDEATEAGIKLLEANGDK